MRVLLLAAVVISFSLPAGADDPRFVWETIDTPHFEVHYHQGEHELAVRVARMAELAHKKLQPVIDHEPSERCHVVVSDETDFANGSATPLLRNTINVFAPPPDARSTLNDFDDYVWELVSHEYTHILHIDTTFGLPEVTNQIFGKLWLPNGAQPRWFIEGYAVYQESAQSASGRERSAAEEMAVRAQVLAGSFPTLSQLSNLPLQWPRGDIWYTIGGRFLAYIGDKYGGGALRDLSHDYGGRPIPFGLNLSASAVLGKSYLDLYDEFRREEKERALEVVTQVREEGETPVEVLTALGERTRSPRFSRDGSTIYYSSQGPDRLPEIRALALPACCELSGKLPPRTSPRDTHLADSYSDATLGVLPDGRVVYSREQIYQRYEDLEDLYAVDPTTREVRRLTRGVRASEPDAAPDGTLVFVWRRPGGRTAIAELAPGSSSPKVLFQDAALEPVGSPRVSPDGSKVAFLHHRNASWDVRVLDRATGNLTEVTNDRSLERDPTWTPDGKRVIFASDRSGVFDLYSFRLEDSKLERITRVPLGAFEPAVSPDGQQIVFVTYSVRGFDLARLPFAPDKLLPAPRNASADRPRPAEEPPRELFPSHPYQPLATLRPYYWAPFAATDAIGTTLGAMTSGSDIVGRHEYAASAWWSVDGRQPGYSLRYTSHAQHPDLTLSTSRDLVDVAGVGCSADGTGYVTCTAQRDLHAGAQAFWSFPTVERNFSLTLGYDVDFLSNDTLAPGLDVPREGTFAAASITLGYSDARRFVRSISSEEGLRASLTARLADPALGSSFRYRLVGAAVAKYFAMPWSTDGRPWHHVLAVRTAGAIGLSEISPARLFSLGGFGFSDAIRQLVNLQDAPVRTLRGYQRGSFSGDAYVLGTIEYRLPITDVEIGAWTLPFYIRRIHAAGFLDVGDAFDWRPGRITASHVFKLHAGAGAELRTELVLGYILATDVRFGCARGLENSARAVLDCYVAIGVF